MPVQLYDNKTGAPALVDASKALAGVLDGSLAPKPDELIHVVLADGRKGTVAGHELASTIEGGATILDPDVEHHNKVREEQSGFGGGVGAAVGGAFNGATGGLGLGAVRQGIKAFSPEAGQEFQDTVQAQREEHPIAAVGGEVAGAAGLAYLAHRNPIAKLAPAGAIDALGAMAERNVGAAVAGLGSTTARAAATSAARAGVEGALYGAGTHVGEDMLGDHATAGDKLLIATAQGGAFGLGLGGVLGGGVSLVKGLRGAASKGGAALISEGATEMLTAAEKRLATAEAGHADATKRAGSGISGLVDDPITASRRDAVQAELRGHEKEIAEATQEIAHAKNLHSLSGEVAAENPHGVAAEFAYNALGATKGMTKKLGPEGVIARGETALRMGIVDVGEGKGVIKATLGSLSENTPENMLGRTQTKLADLVNKLDTIGGTKTTATLGELLEPIDRQIAEMEKVSTTVPVAQRLRAQKQALLGTPKFRNLLDVDGNLIAGADKTPVSLSDIIAERRGMGRTAFAVGDVNAHTIKAANSELYAAFSKLEEDALDRASHLQGVASGAEFKSLKTDVSHLIDIEKALENRIAGATAGRSHGILDHLVGLGASHAAGSVLPFAGHAVGGAMGAMLSKGIRERGDAAAAVALTKIADIGAVKHLMGTVDKAVGRAAKGLTSTAEKTARKTGTSAPREPLAARYRAAEAKLSAMENQHSSISERAMASTKDLAQHAPNVSQAFAMSMARAAAFLSSKRPQPLMPADPYTGRAPSILDTDKLAFLRSYEAVTNPMGILKRFEQGTVTPEDTEALKATAPTVYAELQQAVMKEVGLRHAQGKPMPFKQRVQMGLLFDVPADPCLDKANYKALQANVFTPPAPPQPPSGGGKSNAPRRPVKLPGTGMSPLDKLAQNGAGRR